MVRRVISMSSAITRTLHASSSTGSFTTVPFTNDNAKSPMLMASPMPSVRCKQGSPRRSSASSAMSSWMSAAVWKCSMAAAALVARAMSPPTARQAAKQMSGRWRLPPFLL